MKRPGWLNVKKFNRAGILRGKYWTKSSICTGSKDTRKFTPANGVKGLYSMKRLGL